MNRKDLKTLALTRLREAKVLLANGEYSGAYYLAGYVVECALKACIAKQTRIHDFPDKQRALDSWNHDPTKLIHTADLQTERNREISADERFEENWNVVKDWSEQSRYSNNISEIMARNFFSAVTEKGSGVLSWLRKRW